MAVARGFRLRCGRPSRRRRRRRRPEGHRDAISVRCMIVKVTVVPIRVILRHRKGRLGGTYGRFKGVKLLAKSFGKLLKRFRSECQAGDARKSRKTTSTSIALRTTSTKNTLTAESTPLSGACAEAKWQQTATRKPPNARRRRPEAKIPSQRCAFPTAPQHRRRYGCIRKWGVNEYAEFFAHVRVAAQGQARPPWLWSLRHRGQSRLVFSQMATPQWP